MYKNKARLEHEATLPAHEDDSSPENGKSAFDMAQVIIPTITRRPHAISSAYRSQVNSEFYLN
jgi:hypothetical protein